MLGRLVIKNFQAHKRSRFILHPGVNVFIGASNKGKTTVIRALRWAIRNVPGGDAFFPTFGGNPDVTVDEVRRFRSKSKNEYYFRSEDPLKAFQTSPPEEVQEYFNMPDINWAMQHDPPFMVADTPGAVARQLNAAIDLDVIDTSLKKQASAKRNAISSVNSSTEQVETLQERIGGYDCLPQREKAVSAVSQLGDTVLDLEEERDFIVAMVEKHEAARKELESLPDIPRAEKRLARLDHIHERIGQFTVERDALHKLCRKIEDITQQISEAENVMDLDQVCSDLQQDANGLYILRNEKKALERLVGDHARFKKTMEDAKKQRIDLEKKLPSTCPVCGGPLDG